MSAVVEVNVEAAMERLRTAALKVKAERDEYEAALHDIIFGADMMLQPSLNLSGAMLGYVKEVRRVAQEALNVRA